MREDSRSRAGASGADSSATNHEDALAASRGARQVGTRAGSRRRRFDVASQGPMSLMLGRRRNPPTAHLSLDTPGSRLPAPLPRPSERPRRHNPAASSSCPLARPARNHDALRLPPLCPSCLERTTNWTAPRAGVHEELVGGAVRPLHEVARRRVRARRPQASRRDRRRAALRLRRLHGGAARGDVSDQMRNTMLAVPSPCSPSAS
jgi:hypothetical protein